MANTDKKLASNPQNWSVAQRYIRIEHNKKVAQWFKIVGTSSRVNLRNSVLIYSKDTASQMLAKMQFFNTYIRELGADTVSFPLQFSTKKLPNVAQLALIYRPTNKQSQSGNYTLHIPQYTGNKNPKVSSHTKGNYWAKYTCKDNASILVYCSSKAEAIRVARELNRYVTRKYKSDEANPSTGYMEHEPNKVVKVKPIRADYYKAGTKFHPHPDWRKYFS